MLLDDEHSFKKIVDKQAENLLAGTHIQQSYLERNEDKCQED